MSKPTDASSTSTDKRTLSSRKKEQSFLSILKAVYQTTKLYIALLIAIRGFRV